MSSRSIPSAADDDRKNSVLFVVGRGIADDGHVQHIKGFLHESNRSYRVVGNNEDGGIRGDIRQATSELCADSDSNITVIFCTADYLADSQHHFDLDNQPGYETPTAELFGDMRSVSEQGRLAATSSTNGLRHSTQSPARRIDVLTIGCLGAVAVNCADRLPNGSRVVSFPTLDEDTYLHRMAGLVQNSTNSDMTADTLLTIMINNHADVTVNPTVQVSGVGFSFPLRHFATTTAATEEERQFVREALLRRDQTLSGEEAALNVEDSQQMILRYAQARVNYRLSQRQAEHNNNDRSRHG